MPSSSRNRWVIACVAGVLLAGCDQAPPANAPAAGPAAKAPRSKAGLLPPDMVAAVSSTRNASVVSVHFQLKGSPTAGKALPVDIAIVPHVPMSYLTVRFQARDGLAVATGDLLERRAEPAPDTLITHQLVLLPSAEGVFMLTAIVETGDGDDTVSRLFSIPVIVGPESAVDPQAPAAAPATPTPAESPAPAPASG